VQFEWDPREELSMTIDDALLEHVHRRSTLDVVRQVVREELAPYGIAHP
jgi:hypothetical protein